MLQVLQNFRGAFAPAQSTAENEFIDEVRRRNGRFRQKLGAIKQQQHQIEERWIVRPGFVKHRAAAVSSDEAVEPRKDAVGIGKNCGLRSVSLRRKGFTLALAFPPL